MSGSLSKSYRADAVRAVPTPGFRNHIDTATSKQLSVPQPRQSRGGDAVATQGCTNRLSQEPALVSPQPLDNPVKTQLSSVSGQSPGRLSTGVPLVPRRVASIDRTGCPARTDSKGRPQHGTVSAYRNFNCRCPDALKANRNDRKFRSVGLVPPAKVNSIGTARRLRALACLGWPLRELAERLGVHTSRVEHLRSQKYPVVSRHTHAAVAALYGALEYTDGGDTRAARHAVRVGWSPPAAWDDIDNPDEKPLHQLGNSGEDSVNDEYVDLHELLAGRLPGSRSWHRGRLNRMAVEILTRRGCSVDAIAERLKITKRSVERMRASATKTVGPRLYDGQHDVGTTPPATTPRQKAPAA